VSRPPDAGCVGIDLDERGARSAPAVAATCRSLLLVSRRRSLAKERKRIVLPCFSPSRVLFSRRVKFDEEGLLPVVQLLSRLRTTIAPLLRARRKGEEEK
jgi:hypothetical protein